MKNWFRKIELPEHDVLVVRNSSDEDGEYVEISVQLDGMTASMKLGFEDDSEKADKCLNTYNVANATEFVKNMNGCFN